MQQLHLSIPAPCHEDWHNMTPTQQGRFCNACAKQVVDFSAMSDAEVLNYFSTVKNEKVCGRAYPDQLERTITMPAAPKKRLFWYWNYITMLFLFFGKTNAAKAQIGKIAVSNAQSDSTRRPTINKVLNSQNATQANTIIKGKVVDNSGVPIAGASIVIKGTNQGTMTDTEGRYSIIAHSTHDVLKINSVGFVQKEIQLNTLKNADIILTKMELSVLGEVVVGGVYVSNEFVTPAPQSKHVVVFEIKDEKTLQPVSNASVIFEREGTNKRDAVVTDKKGIYKLRKIKKEDTYTVKVIAAGYQVTEFTVSGTELESRKTNREVLLNRAEPLVEVKSIPYSGIIVGKMATSIYSNKMALYVIDQIQYPDGVPAGFNWGNVDKITILKQAEATAIYGAVASKGAMIITTKSKAKTPVYKSLDSVFINSGPVCLKSHSVTGAVMVNHTVKRTIADTIKVMTTKISGALKIYPNPVKKGEAFTIGLKLTSAGSFNVQVIDATGKIVLQQQVVAGANNYTGPIQTSNTWSSGVYYIRVFDSNNKMLSTNSVLVQ